MDIYRFVSFFELYELIINKKLKFSKLNLMDDQNEGLAESLVKLAAPDSLGFNIMEPVDTKRIIDLQKKIQHSRYITCWTKEKDSMAMWLLYSKNKDSIRIKTSIKKLKFYTNSFIQKNTYEEHLKSKEGTLQILTFNNVHYFNDVKYVSFSNLISSLKDLHTRQQKDLLSANLDVSNYVEHMEKYYNEGRKIIDDELFLKDSAYEFEKEVRASFNVVARNGITYEEWEEKKDSFPIWEKEFLLPTVDFDYNVELFPNIINIPIEADFIEEICFDPRMLEYQQDIYKNILGMTIPYTTTNVFGHLSDSIELGMDS